MIQCPLVIDPSKLQHINIQVAKSFLLGRQSQIQKRKNVEMRSLLVTQSTLVINLQLVN